MTSSSSSSSINTIPENKHDVFLSFRGEDTRNNFTSHLYAALCKKQIETFIDDQLNRGDEISQSLLNAIEGSNVSVIIFSEQYASSGWCLDELVKILECKNKCGQIVIPVFYRVDPSAVRNQTGIFGDAFSKLEERYKEEVEKLQKWRMALREAANLSGFDSNVVRPESMLVENIVEDILKRLNDIFPNNFDKDLIGIQSRIKDIELLLSYVSTDVNKLGIWGIGGIGKTTIAGAIFNKISSHFDSSYFIQNVREESEKIGGLAHLQRELLSTLLDDRSLNIGITRFSLNFERKRLGRKKVLIIFDDVTCFEQIESLIGSLDWLKPGSMIVITTRNKQVLKNCGVKKIYEMKELEDVHSLKLFSRHAFKQNHPNVGYEELSFKVMKYCQGVPLALGVLGRVLFGKEKDDWESAINKLERIPNMDIQNVLKVSYDSLDDEEKNIFLDIACFFKGNNRDFIKTILDASGFSAKIGITGLIDKGLIVISNNLITMHDLLQQMGRGIVRQESVDFPEKRSRLWYPKDIYEVLTCNTGTEAIQGISFDMSKVEEISLNFYTFQKMPNLRFLKLYGKNKCKICHFGVPGSIFPKLRYLHWNECPLKLLPSTIRTENLVSLELPNSKVEQLWDGVQNLVNSRTIDLQDSKQLMKLPDLSNAQNLEKLNLFGCSSLVETHSSIEYLNKLVILDLEGCKSLKHFPSSIRSESLEILSLSNCSNMKRLPEILSRSLTRLYLDGTAIEELPSSIEHRSSLVTLNLENCLMLESLPSSLCKLKSLERLYLSGCSNLRRLPDEIGNLEALRRMHVDGTAIREVPSSIVCLKNLQKLSFERLKSHEQMRFILPILFSLDGLRNITSLSLADCGIIELPENLGRLSSLEYLHLRENNFERIPKSVINLSKLRELYMSYCERLQSLPKLPCSIELVDANHCTSLESLSGFSISNVYFKDLALTNCYKLDPDELRKLVEDVLQKIMLIATSWWKAPKGDQIYYGGVNARIIFPGSEISNWFKFQNMGSSITLELPAIDQFYNEFVGFAFCVIIAFEEHHYGGKFFNLYFELKVKTEGGDWHFASDGRLFIARSFDYVDSSHVFFGCKLSTRMLLYLKGKLGDINEAFVQFYLTDCEHERMDCCEVVRKCGIHFFYAQDLEESMKDFTTGEEEEQDRHPKRLKYSTD